MVERATVEEHERGVRSAINATSALTEGTARVEPASVAEKAAAAKPEALEPRAESEDGRTRKEPPPVDATECSPEPPLPLLPRECPAAGEHEGGHGHVLSP
jgi:hypothetical protein